MELQYPLFLAQAAYRMSPVEISWGCLNLPQTHQGYPVSRRPSCHQCRLRTVRQNLQEVWT
jgi:hypothetical protein